MSTRDHENDDEFRHGNEYKHEDDDFGLPEVEYDQVRDEEEVVEEHHHHVAATSKPNITRDRREEKSGGGAALIVVFILLLIAVGGGVWWFFLREPEPEPVREIVQETTTTEPEPADDFDNGFDDEEVVEEPAEPVSGQINNLSSRTGRYYVVVNSFFDGDMAMDYAKKLSGDGVNVNIILPSGKNKFHRVAVEDFDSYAAAVDKAEELKATYGNETWAVRY